jgi:hypothetical protein
MHLVQDRFSGDVEKMIIEVAIVSVSAVIVSSLAFASRVLKMQAKADSDIDPSAERRKLLERQRDEWIKAAYRCGTYEHSQRREYLSQAAKVNEQLIKLTERSK